MGIGADVEEALVAEDVADLVNLLRQRSSGDSELEAVLAAVIRRHRRSAVKLTTAAKSLGVSTPTVVSWMERGVLVEVTGHPVRKVSAVSLGNALALIRQLKSSGMDKGERLLRALENIRDKDLLSRARQASETDGDGQFVTYDEAALDQLRKA